MRALGKASFRAWTAFSSSLPSSTPPFELEVLKAVLLIGGPGQRHNGVGGQRLLVAQAVPGAVGVGLGVVGQIGLLRSPT